MTSLTGAFVDDRQPLCRRPVGIETIAAALSEPRDAIEDIIEPYLIQQVLSPAPARPRPDRERLATPWPHAPAASRSSRSICFRKSEMPASAHNRRKVLQFTLMPEGRRPGSCPGPPRGQQARHARLATDGRGWGVPGASGVWIPSYREDRAQPLEATLALGHLPTGKGKPKEMHNTTWRCWFRSIEEMDQTDMVCN